MRRKSFHAGIWSKLLGFSKSLGLFEPHERIIAAVSGGPDSVCLLHFLKQLSRKTGCEVIACHVNHGIRGAAADADEKFVRKLAEKLGVRCVVKRASAPAAAKKHRLSVEHAARKIRYRALESAAKQFKCKKIAAGHHLDDHAETIILNLLRGTNAAGLLGIPPKRKLPSGAQIARPLLCLKRAEVMEYLRQHKLPFRKDETNEDEKYTRNWVRRKLLPLIESKQPRFREHLLQMSESLSGMIKGK